MREQKTKRVSAGLVVTRVLACLLLAASLSMLFLPWASFRLEEGGARLTLRQLARGAARHGVETLPDSIQEPERELYTQLLSPLEPLLDNQLSPLNAALACLRSAAVLQRQQSAGGFDAAWSQKLADNTHNLRLTGLFLLVLLGFLVIAGLYAIYSAAAGYGFGTIPYFFGGGPTVLALFIACSRANVWFQGGSAPAAALRGAIESYRSSPNPLSDPFRLALGGILFPALLAGGILLAFCALQRKEDPEELPEAAYPFAGEPGARPLKTWRCPRCNTLMGDGVYCVKCGARKLEPRRCGFCGELLESDAVFCSFCGSSLTPTNALGGRLPDPGGEEWQLRPEARGEAEAYRTAARYPGKDDPSMR